MRSDRSEKGKRDGSLRMPKNRIGQTMKDAMQTKKGSTNRSSDLSFLSSQFDVVKIKLSQLIDALKGHYKSLLQINKTRLLVAQRVSALATNSPIALHAGIMPMEDTRGDQASSPMDSYLDIHQHLGERQKIYTDRFLDHVVQYSIDWFTIIESRVTSSIKKSHRLRKELEHYESKVNRLHFDKGRIAKSGTGTDSYMSVNTKLERNEAKLKSAREEYEAFSASTTALVEEVTSRCWKDLFPVLLKLTQFDASLALDEQQLLQHLDSLSKSLIVVQEELNFDPESRLQELESFGTKFLLMSQNSDQGPQNDENSDVMIHGIHDHVRSPGDHLPNVNSNCTQHTTNVRPDGSYKVGSERIRSFTGTSPKIEVDLSSRQDSPRKSRPFTGRETDQNASVSSSSRRSRDFTGPTGRNPLMSSPTVIKHKIAKSRRKENNSTQSYCSSHLDPFADIDEEESVNIPLTPVARYE